MTTMSTTIEPTEISYAVPGISCEHCRVAIEAEVGQLRGVGAVAVDLEHKTVTVTGAALDDAAIRNAIDDAGYDVA
jgi:copper chaperone